jgi:hypothetical protein
VSALTDAEVGTYFRQHFVASFQKVGTFRIVDGQKQGGNVASYFCTPGGRVLHAVAGPVDAATLLREAKWAVETWKLARLECGGDARKLGDFFHRAHARRFREDNVGEAQRRVHLILTAAPLPRVAGVYRVVFEKVLGEQVSTDPVAETGAIRQ